MKKQKKFTEKGITLIALIITIIVLLILAGVTIAAISGNEGVLEKAQSAKGKTDVANAKEAAILKTTEYIQDYYQGKYVDNDSSVTTYTTAGAYVAKQFETQAQSGNYYIKTDANTRDLKISLDASQSNVIVEGEIADGGTITWSDEVASGGGGSGTPTALSVDTLQGMVGKTVLYSGYSASYNSGWRLFYADTYNAYLITTETITSSIAFPREEGDTTKGIPLSSKDPTTVMGEGTYGGTWNSMWLGRTNAVTSENRHKAVTYLCDSDNWTSYVATNAPTGTKAYGGPSLQLFVEAWNLRQRATSTTSIDRSSMTDYGYRQTISSGITTGTKAADGSEKIYNNGSNYWLASPEYYSNGGSSMLLVSSYNESVSSLGYSTDNAGARPIVVIPRAKIQQSTTDTTKLEVIMNTAN